MTILQFKKKAVAQQTTYVQSEYMEFRSPTQKPIRDVSTQALRERVKGITNVRNLIQQNLGTDLAKELISAMNFSVSQANKELKGRK